MPVVPEFAFDDADLVALLPDLDERHGCEISYVTIAELLHAIACDLQANARENEGRGFD
jgi:hypothetical protein